VVVVVVVVVLVVVVVTLVVVEVVPLHAPQAIGQTDAMLVYSPPAPNSSTAQSVVPRAPAMPLQGSKGSDAPLQKRSHVL
jgi:hypothetical protein